jgi:hypothetical protein
MTSNYKKKNMKAHMSFVDMNNLHVFEREDMNQNNEWWMVL